MQIFLMSLSKIVRKKMLWSYVTLPSIISEKQSALTGAKACKVIIRRKKKGPRVKGLNSGGHLTLCPLRKC